MTRQEATEFVNKNAVVRGGKPKDILTPAELAGLDRKPEYAISTEVKVGKKKLRAISVCRLWAKKGAGPEADYMRADGKRALVRRLMGESV